jgi:organic radical activating enzyme
MTQIAKIDPFPGTKIKFVEWMLHNECNYDCAFCGNPYKDGSKRWLSLELYKKYVDNIVRESGDTPLWIQITGGEPTLFPELKELLEYIKSKNVYTSLISNGSRTVRWWTELRDSHALDKLFITCHTNQITDYSQIIEILNLFHEEYTDTICLITHDKHTIDDAINARKNIMEETSASVMIKAMNTTDNHAEYSDEQLQQVGISYKNITAHKPKQRSKVPNTHKIAELVRVGFADSTIKLMSPQMLLKTNQTNFQNWNCQIGIDYVRVLVDKVYRGVCEQGDIQTDLENFKFNDSEIVCQLDKCFCHNDIIIKKYNAK